MSSNRFERMLARERLVLLDGGTGTELRRRGVALSADVWSGAAARDHEAVLQQIHRDYIEAGADIVTTNTFATTRFVLAGAGLSADFETINRSAVRAATAARDTSAARPVAIAGSLSCFPPRFDARAYPSPAVERAAYRELADLLADAGVDLIAVEMIQDATHGLRALDAALATGLPVMLGLSVRREAGRLVAFDDFERALASYLEPLLARNPSVVAIMHSPRDAVSDALAALAAAGWRGPTGAYPELGTVPGPAAPAGAAASPAELAAAAAAWVDQGVRVLGGCCGTGPEHIAALAALRERISGRHG